MSFLEKVYTFFGGKSNSDVTNGSEAVPTHTVGYQSGHYNGG
ncbi:hypothetical protein [Desulfobacula toluolica]|nr:hypothetical protein [Desulfobacula toluolica]